MTSLYRRILLWFVLLLAASVAIIVFTSPMILLRFSGPSDPVSKMHLVFFRQAREAFDSGGPAALRSYLDSLEAQLPARYVLVDSEGRDLATSEDRGAMLRAVREGSFMAGKGLRATRVFSEGTLHFIALIRPESPVAGAGPYLLLVFVIIAVLCWLFATQLASPVRELAQVMQRFGRGDMTARSRETRRDEIGGLARSFNEMADRINGLVAAERRLLQDVSHELQSPLARLTVAARLASSGDNREPAIARLRKEVARMSEMVTGLLDITRAEGDPASLQRDPVDLKETVAEIVADCEWESSEKNVTLRADLAGVTVAGNYELLRRAIENVLRNAIRYSPEGESVEVAVAAVGPEVAVTIRDHGPGVPEDALDRIFAPFYRVEESRERDGPQGAGLGLALAQRAVLLHRGSIQAENARPGLRVIIRLGS